MLKILSHKGRNKAVTPRMLFASTSSKKISWRVGPLCCRLHCFIISVAFRSFDSKMFLWGCPSRLFSVIQSVLTVLGLSPRLSLVYKGNHNKEMEKTVPSELWWVQSRGDELGESTGLTDCISCKSEGHRVVISSFSSQRGRSRAHAL